ncbi:hypothetical protein FBEOM_8406 [Fusarium beomiforme]|uniref:C2H2-type domain-containing protein n=1 Tax=Fusarium beomiforme TaxID=44412 RepID=A0A9P5DXA3_9HYPO|nr:hypothetical protein FBEOM_8406 [Fusarium beomiforme]
MTESNFSKLSAEQISRQSNHQAAHTGDARGTKRSRPDRGDPWADQSNLRVDSQPNAALHRCAAPLSVAQGSDSQCSYTYHSENKGDAEDFISWENSLASGDGLEAHRLKLKPHALAMFKDWRTKMEYIAPLEDGLHPSKRLRSSFVRPTTDTLEDNEHNISDEELVVVSHPTHSRAFFHLACPFYFYDPEQCQTCLLKSDLQSIEDVVEHLFHCHSRPSYCSNCYEAFDSQIGRDDHVLRAKCQRRASPEPLLGLAESQKSMLLEIDTRYAGEREQWFDIWSVSFPKSREPVSPYLDYGCGLIISMLRDFWDSCGLVCIEDSLKDQNIPQEQYQSLVDNLYELLLEDLLHDAIDDYKCSGVT